QIPQREGCIVRVNVSIKRGQGHKVQPGLLALSMRRELFGHQAWTLSLWDSEGNKDAFVHSSVHLIAMKQSDQLLKKARFLNISWSGRVGCLSWKVVLPLMKHSREYSLKCQTQKME
ncbi:hypothetical protein, partial [Limnobacter litoralis]|uniref:hypothetical protein n=1 Tax=Limnobacter litoralis TaxID=481366 RepID=UPI0024E0741A